MDGPFDTYGAVKKRQAFSQNSAFPDPSYVPDTGNIPTTPAEPNTQQVQDDQADQEGQQLLAQQAKQAQANQVAQQKTQVAQDKVDTTNWQTQANESAASDKAAGIITSPDTIPGPDDKDIKVQARTQNPDGSTAYQAADLGVKTMPDGSAYRVRRNQWGALDYSDPYAAGTNANVSLTPTGQIMATPKGAPGKGAPPLPSKDVTTQGITGLDAVDAQGNPDPSQLKVSANAAINQPQVQAGIDAEEQKLLTGNPDGSGRAGAAGERVGDTVGATASDALQKSKDADADVLDARAQHADALEALKTASDPATTNYDMGKLQANVKAAQDEVNRSQAALMAAAQTKVTAKTASDAATATATKAKADPLNFLQDQSDAQSQATEQANGNLPPPSGTQPTNTGSPQPSVPTNLADQSVGPAYQGLSSKQLSVMAPPPGFEDHHAAAVQVKAAQEAGQIPPMPTAQPGAPTNTDPNSITGLMAERREWPECRHHRR